VLTGLYPILLFVFGDPDPGSILTSYLGLFLVCGGFAAAGLFTSTLARDQMVAGVAGIFVLLPFWMAGVAVDQLPAFLEPVLTRMSLLDHLRSFAQGVIDTGDIAWFVAFTGVFLFLTWRAIESRRWR